MESILTSIKGLLGVPEDHEHFDGEIITHINSVFMDLNGLSVGPSDGFMITDKTTIWTDYVRDITRVSAIKSYMYLRVKMLFDPPASSAVIESINRQIEKWEWKINNAAESGPSEDQLIIAELTAKVSELQARTIEYENLIKELETMIDESGVLNL